MALKSRSQLQTQINNDIYQNNTGDITAPVLNQLLENIVDSATIVSGSTKNDLIPNSDAVYNIGSSSATFNKIYAQNIDLGGNDINNKFISGLDINDSNVSIASLSGNTNPLLNFGDNLSAIDDGNNEVTINAIPTGTTIEVQQSNSTILSGTSILNFSDDFTVSGSNNQVDVFLSGNTTNISDNNTTVVNNVKNINFGTNLSVTDNSGGTVTIDTSGNTTSPAGSDHEIQFNDNGSFGSDSKFKYDNTNDLLSITGTVDATTIKYDGEDTDNRYLKGLGIENNTSLILSGATNINFGNNLDVEDDNDGTVTVQISGNTASPAGSDHEIQFNDNGSFGASPNVKTNGNYVLINGIGNTNITPTSGLHANTSVATHVTTLNSDLILDDAHQSVYCGTSGGDVNIELPNPSGIIGRIYTVTKATTDNNVVQVGPPSGSNYYINGGNYVELTNAYESITVQNDGNNWYVINCCNWGQGQTTT